MKKEHLRNYFWLAVLSIFSLRFVSSMNFYGPISNVFYKIQPVFEFFLGGADYSGNMLFVRFLFFLIILAVTFVALVKVPFFDKQRNIVIVLSIVVPLLSIRYINFEWLNTMLMAYQVFGIALTSILPFVIYFFFLIGVAPNYPGIRKIGWILFGCVYLGLYYTADNVFYGQVYIWTAVGALAFFLLDGTIQDYFNKQKIKYSHNKHLLIRRLDLEGQRKKLIDAGALDPNNRYSYGQQLKDVESELREIHKEIHN